MAPLHSPRWFEADALPHAYDAVSGVKHQCWLLLEASIDRQHTSAFQAS
jgi:hypothetical protein